jgi:hypothetical protein
MIGVQFQSDYSLGERLNTPVSWLCLFLALIYMPLTIVYICNFSLEDIRRNELGIRVNYGAFMNEYKQDSKMTLMANAFYVAQRLIFIGIPFVWSDQPGM